MWGFLTIVVLLVACLTLVQAVSFMRPQYTGALDRSRDGRAAGHYRLLRMLNASGALGAIPDLVRCGGQSARRPT